MDCTQNKTNTLAHSRRRESYQNNFATKKLNFEIRFQLLHLVQIYNNIYHEGVLDKS